MDIEKKLALLLTVLTVMGAVLVMSGCLGSDERPQEVDLDVLDAELRGTNAQGEEPDEGREFLWLRVEMKNLKDEDIDLSHVLFEVATADGILYHSDGAQEMVTNLHPDGRDVFWLVFDLPEEIYAKELLFEPYDARDPVGWTDIPSY